MTIRKSMLWMSHVNPFAVIISGLSDEIVRASPTSLYYSTWSKTLRFWACRFTPPSIITVTIGSNRLDSHDAYQRNFIYSRGPQELFLYIHRSVGIVHAAFLLSQQELSSRAKLNSIGEQIGESETKSVHYQSDVHCAGRIFLRAAQRPLWGWKWV